MFLDISGYSERLSGGTRGIQDCLLDDCAVIMFVAIYHGTTANQGHTCSWRIHGVLLYALIFSRIVMESSMFIVGTAVKLLKFIVLIMSYPIKLILRLFSPPAKMLARRSAMFMRKLKRGSKIRASRRAFFKKSLKHIIKKI